MMTSGLVPGGMENFTPLSLGMTNSEWGRCICACHGVQFMLGSEAVNGNRWSYGGNLECCAPVDHLTFWLGAIC